MIRRTIEFRNDCERMAQGRSIGSRMVEGACKTAIGKRLEQTGSRWRIPRVERIAALCCVVYSDLLDIYWRIRDG